MFDDWASACCTSISSSSPAATLRCWCSSWPNYGGSGVQGTKTHILRMADAYSTQSRRCWGTETGKGWIGVEKQLTGLARGGRRWRLPTPFRKKIIIWNSRFGPVLMPFLVELWRGVERAGEALLLCTCTHALVLGSKRPTLNAYSSQILLAQCREIVDTTNAMNGSVGCLLYTSPSPRD